MKHPILLVHGVAIRETFFFKAFGGVEKAIRKAGYAVYTANTDGYGSVENNAEQLKDFIQRMIDDGVCEKVNIIAHSKGGLDTKCMLENFQNSDMVASVTTLCTPYDGSPLADKILSLPHFMVKIIEFFLNLFYKIMGDKHPDSLTAGKQLSTKKRDEHFGEGLPPVYWQSYSLEKDGLVPEESANFLNYRGRALPEYIDHIKMGGLCTLRKAQRKEVKDFYVDLCKELENQGF